MTATSRSNIARLVGAAWLLAALMNWPGTVNAASQQFLKTEPPCAGGPDKECITFDGQSPSVLTVRSIKLDQQGPGTGLVFIHGSGHCENGTAGLRVADFDTQIQQAGEAAPSHNGPGGERVGLVLQSSLLGNNDVFAFNLSALRLFRLKSGEAQRYLYRVALNRMDDGVFCKLYNVTLSVLFDPD